MLAEQVITEHEMHHRFDHRDGARQDAGIVAPARGQLGSLSLHSDCLLNLRNRGGRLEGDTEKDVLAIADATLDAAGAVRGRGDFPLLNDEGVVVLAAGEACSREAAANLKSLGGWKAHHRLGEIGLQLVKDGLAQRVRDSANDALDGATDAVTLGSDFLDAGDHRLGGFEIGTTHGGSIDLGGRNCRLIDFGVQIVDRANVGDDLIGGVKRADHLTRHDASGHTPDGLAGGRAATAFPVPDAVLALVGKIGMRGAEHRLHLGVGRGARILVIDGHHDRRAEGLALKDSGEDTALVLLLTRGDDVALARATPVKLNLNLLRSDREPGGTSVDDAADSSSMGFTPSGDTEESSKDTSHKGD